jgi:dTDP-4-dehydrorhamnose 3,5-epimerase
MVRDKQSITRDWQTADRNLIDGVAVVETKNVMTTRGYLTEIYRTDWQLEPASVAQVFQTMLEPGAISAWHAHAATIDRLFVSTGQLQIVLYDARSGSPTQRQLNEFRFGSVRPALVTVPAGIWHGVKNIGSTPAVLLNLVSHAYDYENPDHYRLPVDSAEIPFRFTRGERDALEQAKT